MRGSSSHRRSSVNELEQGEGRLRTRLVYDDVGNDWVAFVGRVGRGGVAGPGGLTYQMEESGVHSIVR